MDQPIALIVSDILETGEFSAEQLRAAHLIVRQLAEHMPWMVMELGVVPRDCVCQKAMLDSADALRVEYKKLLELAAVAKKEAKSA